jgi:hypothetical protein
MQPENITYEQACSVFADAQCISVPYKYHNMDDTEPMQKFIREQQSESGEELINATLSLGSNKMHIVTADAYYIVDNVNEREYDAFYIVRAYGI